jgi:hypothetical protein
MTASDIKQAEARMQTLRQGGYATSARYDKRHARVVVSLHTGVELAFPPALAEGLADATSAELSEIEITPSGLGLHWPRLDVDLYVPALLQGVLGSPRWMAAAALGRAGGSSRSKAKVAAARANGSKGGRPRKTVQA